MSERSTAGRTTSRPLPERLRSVTFSVSLLFLALLCGAGADAQPIASTKAPSTATGMPTTTAPISVSPFTEGPSPLPTTPPTRNPTKSPLSSPTAMPTHRPTLFPSANPTNSPTALHTRSPTNSPTTTKPTGTPTSPTPMPVRTQTESPTHASPLVSSQQTDAPITTQMPTRHPTTLPTLSPLSLPASSPVMHSGSSTMLQQVSTTVDLLMFPVPGPSVMSTSTRSTFEGLLGTILGTLLNQESEASSATYFEVKVTVASQDVVLLNGVRRWRRRLNNDDLDTAGDYANVAVVTVSGEYKDTAAAKTANDTLSSNFGMLVRNIVVSQGEVILKALRDASNDAYFVDVNFFQTIVGSSEENTEPGDFGDKVDADYTSADKTRTTVIVAGVGLGVLSVLVGTALLKIRQRRQRRKGLNSSSEDDLSSGVDVPPELNEDSERYSYSVRGTENDPTVQFSIPEPTSPVRTILSGAATKLSQYAFSLDHDVSSHHIGGDSLGFDSPHSNEENNRRMAALAHGAAPSVISMASYNSLNYKVDASEILTVDGDGASSRHHGDDTTSATNTACSKITKTLTIPPGRLGITIGAATDGGTTPTVIKVKKGSPVNGSLQPGDKIVSFDEIDTRKIAGGTLTKMITDRIHLERTMTVEQRKRTK